jgi:hypothetical protein
MLFHCPACPERRNQNATHFSPTEEDGFFADEISFVIYVIVHYSPTLAI